MSQKLWDIFRAFSVRWPRPKIPQPDKQSPLLPQRTTSNMPSTEQPVAQPPQANDPPSEAPKLSGAELKRQKAAEEAARRPQAVQGKQGGPSGPPPAAATQKGEQKQQKRRGSVSASRDLPVRQAESNATPKEPPAEDKTVEFFRHLSKPHRKTITGTPKDIHPAVQILGMQFSTYEICGSTARLLATLEVFKEVCLNHSSIFSF